MIRAFTPLPAPARRATSALYGVLGLHPAATGLQACCPRRLPPCPNGRRRRRSTNRTARASRRTNCLRRSYVPVSRTPTRRRLRSSARCSLRLLRLSQQTRHAPCMLASTRTNACAHGTRAHMAHALYTCIHMCQTCARSACLHLCVCASAPAPVDRRRSHIVPLLSYTGTSSWRRRSASSTSTSQGVSRRLNLSRRSSTSTSLSRTST